MRLNDKNRYVVFVFEGYYPLGGMNDEDSRHSELPAAQLRCIEALHKLGSVAGGGHVYDRQEDRTVAAIHCLGDGTWTFNDAKWQRPKDSEP